MSTFLIVVGTLTVAIALAWGFRRHESALLAKPTACSGVLDTVFANGATDTPDSLLLSRLLEHRHDCLGDAAYVDQVRRLYVSTQQFSQARTLVASVADGRSLTPDELTAQTAWIDLGEAHNIWVNGNEPAAQAMLAKSAAAARSLAAKWPEWSIPYRILDEGSRLSWAAPSDSATPDYNQIERAAQGKLLNGASVRSISEVQLSVLVAVAGAVATLGIVAVFSGVLSFREMSGYTTSAIGTARPGYVELKGTLHVPEGLSPVVGSLSNANAVWYEVETVSNSKPQHTSYERSAQPILLRDATGDALIQPEGMTVRTRNVKTTLGSSSFSTTRRTTEHMLKDGDEAYVLGELTVQAVEQGFTARTVRRPQNGKQLLVSNFGEEQLLSFEKLWAWVGAAVFVVSSLLLVWIYFQRFHTVIMPGTLS